MLAIASDIHTTVSAGSDSAAWQWSRSLLLVYPRFYALLCALKEFEVDVADNEQRFYISLK